MKTLVVHLTPTPGVPTGISAYTWSMVEALAKRANGEYVVAGPTRAEDVPAAVRATGVEIVETPAIRNETLAAASASRWAPRLAKQLGCDVLLNTQPFGVFRGRVPRVTVVHDLYRVSHGHLYSRANRLQWRVAAHAIRRSRRVVCVSQATADALQATYPWSKPRIRVVKEAARLHPTSTVPLPPRSKPYGLMVANLTPNKNVGLLIDALGSLAEEGKVLPFAIVGRDEYGMLAAARRRYEALDVQLVGPLSDEELARWYTHANVYANTSLAEGFCLPLLEAQAFGVPVVCSDLPVLREVGGDGAVFIDPTEPGQLADALASLWQDPARRSALIASGRRNEQGFSWDRAAEGMEKVLLEACQG